MFPDYPFLVTMKTLWLENTYWNSCYSANVMNTRSRGFLSVHNTVLLDIWWNILIKFNKQIANTFAKIMAAKANSIPFKHPRWSLFCKLLLASEPNSDPC